jgi:predicted amidophosphoribosyltransferase
VLDQVLDDVRRSFGVCFCCSSPLSGPDGLCSDCRKVVDTLPTVDRLPALPFDQVDDD